MLFSGYADLARPIEQGTFRVYYPYGGGPFLLTPTGCAVPDSGGGRTDFALDLVRPNPPSGPGGHADLEFRLAATYPGEDALAYLRGIRPDATLAYLPLTDWQFRLEPGATMPDELLTPIALASDGLGTGRLVMRLSTETGLVLEGLLRDDAAPVQAVAEAQLTGVSPRTGAVVRFRSAALLPALADLTAPDGTVAWRSLAQSLATQAADLPWDISGDYEPRASGEALADRIVARFGSWVSADPDTHEPRIALRADGGTDREIFWALSEPFTAVRRVALRFDLLANVRRRIRDHGVDAFVRWHTAAADPALGRSVVTAFDTLPAQRQGLVEIGATLTFPPRPPDRPQPETVTVALQPPDDLARVPIRLAPGEPLDYDVTTYAVLADEDGVREVTGRATRHSGSPLRLSPDDFPVGFVTVEATPELLSLARVTGQVRYTSGGREHPVPYEVGTGRPAVAVAVPDDGELVGVTCTALAPDGARIDLGPYESRSVRLDLPAFPQYGWHEAEFVCDFDGRASLYAIDVLSAGVAETPENLTVLAFTLDHPSRRFGWFAHSPFAAGFRYRPHRDDGAPGVWQTVAAPGATVVVRPELAPPAAERIAVAIAENSPLWYPPTLLRLPPTPVPYTGTAPVSPAAEPTDLLLYHRPDDPSKLLYVPRYRIALQTVSGQQRYRIAMGQQNGAWTLTIHLARGPAEALGDAARDATECPHRIEVTLSALQAPPAGARKVLPVQEVARDGDDVTVSLAFATLQERDEIYRALTESDRDASLVVRRIIQVAVPTTVAPPVWVPPRLSGNLVFAPPRDPFLRDPLLKLEPQFLRTTRLTETAPVLTAALARFPDGDVLLGTVSRKPVPDPDDVIFVAALPVPVLACTGRETRTIRGATFVQANLSVTNWQAYSPDFFVPSPQLPPCGANQNASRTWVDIFDAASNARLYGFCALSSPDQLAQLSFTVPDTQPFPEKVYIQMVDRSTGLQRTSNTVPTTAPDPPPPAYQEVERGLEQIIQPQPFAFPPALHPYIFAGIVPGGDAGGLVRYRLPWQGRFHTYLQDQARPSLVYHFPDAFKVARRGAPPFTPWATVRVVSHTGTDDTEVVFDYLVAPYTDTARLRDASRRLAADPGFGAASVQMQPFFTTDVTFTVDRPTEHGSVREVRSGASLILQGGFKDTFTMPLPDFRVLFDAMHRDTASLFLGQVQIAVPGESAEVVPFTARFDDLAGDVFLAAAAVAGGSIRVVLANAIESPVQINALTASIAQGGAVGDASIQGLTLPVAQLAPSATVDLTVVAESALPMNGTPQVLFDFSGVKVLPDPEAIWNAILDRSAVSYFDLYTVKTVPGVFNQVPDHPDDQIVALLVDFEGGGTAELNATTLAAAVRVDFPIDDVILRRPVTTKVVYRLTVVRASGVQQRDPEPRQPNGRTFYVSVQR